MSPSAGAVGSEFVAPTETVLAPTSPGFVPLRGSGVIIVSARSVSKFRNGDSGQKKLLSDVSIEVRTGDFTVITGPSGAGKSTLLNCLAGLDGFDAGDVFIEGHLLNGLTESDRARHRAAALGFVFQGLHLLPTLTVIENTELPLLLAGWSEEDARREAGSALTLAGIADQAIQYPETLSGGELQRAGIARAVVGEPRLVLADEPTGNLDRHTGREIIELFRDLHADGLTLLIATHDERLMELATSIVELENGRLTERRGPRAWR